MKQFLKRFFAHNLLLAETQRNIAREDRDYWHKAAVDYAAAKLELEKRLQDERDRNRHREQQLLNSILFVVKAPTVSLSSELNETDANDSPKLANSELEDFLDSLPGNQLSREEKSLLYQRAAEIAPQKFDVVTGDNILECYNVMLLNAAHYLQN